MYGIKTAFVVSDKDWKSILSLVPVSIWDKDGKTNYNPVFVYKENDFESINNFLEDYKPDKIYFVGDSTSGLSNYKISKININSIIDFWKSVSDVVVADNYENGLMGSVYASYLNAPFFLIEGDWELYKPIINKKNMYLIGSFDKSLGFVDYTKQNAKSVEIFANGDELGRKYKELTQSNKWIIVNPDDISPKIDDVNFVLTSKYGAESEIAPFLAAAKHEVILSSKDRGFDEIHNYLKNNLFSGIAGECKHGEGCGSGYSSFEEYPFGYIKNEFSVDLGSSFDITYINLEAFVFGCNGNLDVEVYIDNNYYDSMRSGSCIPLESSFLSGSTFNGKFLNYKNGRYVKIKFPEGIKIFSPSSLFIHTIGGVKTFSFNDFIGERSKEVIKIPLYSSLSNFETNLNNGERNNDILFTARGFYGEEEVNIFIWGDEVINNELNVIPLKIVNPTSEELNGLKINVYECPKSFDDCGIVYGALKSEDVCGFEHCKPNIILDEIPPNSIRIYDFNYLPKFQSKFNGNPTTNMGTLRFVLSGGGIKEKELFVEFWSKERLDEASYVCKQFKGPYDCINRFVSGGSDRNEVIPASKILSNLELNGIFRCNVNKKTSLNIFTWLSAGGEVQTKQVSCYDKNKIFLNPIDTKFRNSFEFDEDIALGDKIGFNFPGNEFIALDKNPIVSINKKISFNVDGKEDEYEVLEYKCRDIGNCLGNFVSYAGDEKITKRSTTIFSNLEDKDYVLQIRGAAESISNVNIIIGGIKKSIFFSPLLSSVFIDVPKGEIKEGKLSVNSESLKHYWLDLILYPREEKYLTIFANREMIPIKNEIYSRFENRALDGLYVDFTNDNLPDVAVGRIEGLSSGDVSTYVARDIIYPQTTRTGSVSFIGMNVNEPDFLETKKMALEFRKAGYKTDISICDTEDCKGCDIDNLNCCKESPACIDRFIPNIDSGIDGNNFAEYYKDKDLVLYNGHGTYKGPYIGEMELPKLKNTIIINDACATCSTFQEDSFCHRSLRKGSIGYIGAVYEGGSSELYPFFNYVYKDNLAIGEAFRRSNRAMMYFLLGDPTLVVNPNLMLKEPICPLYSELINEECVCKEGAAMFNQRCLCKNGEGYKWQRALGSEEGMCVKR